jgi:hypothetical protein
MCYGHEFVGDVFTDPAVHSILGAAVVCADKKDLGPCFPRIYIVGAWIKYSSPLPVRLIFQHGFIYSFDRCLHQ